MDDAILDSLVEYFGKLTPDVAGELAPMLRLYNIDSRELFFKWESYCLKFSLEAGIKIDLDRARDFKRDVADTLEREVKKNRGIGAAGAGGRTVKKEGRDGLGLFETPQKNSGMKRKFERTPYETPSSKSAKVFNAMDIASPVRAPMKMEPQQPQPVTPFSKRPQPGTIRETLNDHIPKPTLPLTNSAPYDTRVTLMAGVEFKKFGYRPMYQKLYEASEMLDDKIEEVISLVIDHYGILPDEISDPGSPSPGEIVAVGRICSDSLQDGKLTATTVMLESSRRYGAGSRVPLKLDQVDGYAFFPGQIVALRGISPSGQFFTVKEILELPRLPSTATSVDNLIATAERLSLDADGAVSDELQSAGGLNIIIAAGPYTTDDNLDFEPLAEICRKAMETRPDAVILMGPFVDTEHPLVQQGDFDLESVDPNEDSTLDDLFRERISSKIRMIRDSLVLLVPSTRDAISKHVSFPQEAFVRKSLELPKNIKCLPNPAIFSLNEVIFATSTADCLFDLLRTQIHRPPSTTATTTSSSPIAADRNPTTRGIQHIISQRSLYPIFPPPATSADNRVTQHLDLTYLRLADFLRAVPDVLVLPSQLDAFAKAVDSVVAVNPGWASKKIAMGTYVEMFVKVKEVVEGEEEVIVDGKRSLLNNVWERTRVDVLRV